MLLTTLLLATSLAIPGEIPLAKPGLAISTAREEWPSVASDGDGYLVVWTGDFGVLASRYRPNGEMVDVDPIVISAQAHVRPRVTWIGSGYLVTYANRYALVTTGGMVARDDVLPFPPEDPTVIESAIAWNRRNVIVATTSASLAIYDKNMRLLRDPLPRRSGTFAVVATAKGFVSLSRGTDTTTATPISDDGVVGDSDVTVTDFTVSAASNGQRIALYQFRLGTRSVTMLDSDLRVVAKKALSFGQAAAAQQINPVSTSENAAAASDQGFLFAENQALNGFGVVYLFRITPDGDAIDPKPIAASPTKGLTPIRSPSAASNGRAYFVVWNDGRRDFPTVVNQKSAVEVGTDVWGANVPATGPVTTMPVVLGPAAQTRPVAAFNGLVGLVAWAESTTNYLSSRVVAVRIAADGAVLDRTPVEVVAGGTPIAIASDGNDFLLVWKGDSGTVCATMVRADGSVLPAHTLSNQGLWEEGSVAFDGENFFIVWRDYSTRGARIGRDNHLLDPVPFDFGPYANPSIAYDGVRFWIPFQTGEVRPFNRNGFPDGAPVGFGGDWQGLNNLVNDKVNAIGCRNGRCAVTVLRNREPSFGVAVFDGSGVLVAPTLELPFGGEISSAVLADDAGFFVTGEDHFDVGRGVAVARSAEITRIDAVAIPLDFSSGMLQPFATTTGRRAVAYARAVAPDQLRVFLRFVAQPRRRAAR